MKDWDWDFNVPSSYLGLPVCYGNSGLPSKLRGDEVKSDRASENHAKENQDNKRRRQHRDALCQSQQLRLEPFSGWLSYVQRTHLWFLSLTKGTFKLEYRYVIQKNSQAVLSRWASSDRSRFDITIHGTVSGLLPHHVHCQAVSRLPI